MRGYFGVGSERISKAMNLGAVLRTAHAFNAIELPSFRHPLNAAYLLGPEKGSLSPEASALCTHLVKIPTRFCVNLSVAAALVMYDRMISMGGYAPRPVSAGGPPPTAEWRAPRRR